MTGRHVTFFNDDPTSRRPTPAWAGHQLWPTRRAVTFRLAQQPKGMVANGLCCVSVSARSSGQAGQQPLQSRLSHSRSHRAEPPPGGKPPARRLFLEAGTHRKSATNFVYKPRGMQPVLPAKFMDTWARLDLRIRLIAAQKDEARALAERMGKPAIQAYPIADPQRPLRTWPSMRPKTS